MQFLHTMIRVGDLDRSINFYTNALGMKIIKKSENSEYKYTLVFLGYEANPTQAELELTYNWGVDKYELGTAYGHIAIGVEDIFAACEKVKTAGGKITREPGPVLGGTSFIAFCEDPDGYKIEFIVRSKEFLESKAQAEDQGTSV